MAVVRQAGAAFSPGDLEQGPAVKRVLIARISVSSVVPISSMELATVRIGWSGRNSKSHAVVTEVSFGTVGTK